MAMMLPTGNVIWASLSIVSILLALMASTADHNMNSGVPTLTAKADNFTVYINRDGRLIFTVVRFANSFCGSGLESGTCLTAGQCAANGGNSLSKCAKGHGACCKVTSTACGGDIRINNTWIQNPEYPGYFNEARVCTWRVYFDDRPGKICQIRYDFGPHTLKGPTDTGICTNDQLIFRNDPKSKYFCGVAPDNYHWYVETADTLSPHTFTIKTDSSDFNRRYLMRVSFIPCKLRVPTKCGQYYTGLSGTITSYNYNQRSYYLAGLSYSICFRREKGYCTYTLKKTNQQNQFIDINDVLKLMMGNQIETIPNPLLGSFANICNIKRAKQDQLYFSNEQCLYPNAMTSVHPTAPFFVTVKTNEDIYQNFNQQFALVPAVLSGFQFNWTHNKCSGTCS